MIFLTIFKVAVKELLRDYQILDFIFFTSIGPPPACHQGQEGRGTDRVEVHHADSGVSHWPGAGLKLLKALALIHGDDGPYCDRFGEYLGSEGGSSAWVGSTGPREKKESAEQ